MSKLIQIGVVGYDQWQVTSQQWHDFDHASECHSSLRSGKRPTFLLGPFGWRARELYSSQEESVFWFKYYHEYNAYSRPIGNTIVFRGTWTLKIPKS